MGKKSKGGKSHKSGKGKSAQGRSNPAPLKGASQNRLTLDWILSDMSSDAKLRQNLRLLRTRSRDLAANDPYMTRFLNQVRANVIGPHGIRLDIDLRGEDGKKDRDGAKRIKDAWRAWGRVGVCTMDGVFEQVGLQQMLLTSAVVDGEILARRRRVDNGFGFALQVIEGDYLDHELNKNLGDGRTIRLGVQFDKNRRPTRYHFRDPVQNDVVYSPAPPSRYEVLAADDIIHLFMKHRFSLTRGVPWINAAMMSLRQFGGYSDAAVIAARIGAAKMGFYERETADDEPTGNKDAENNVLTEVAPGELEPLPPGWKFKEFNPGYPTGDYDSFSRAMLRGVAAGLNVNYAGMTYDLTGVNFSSLRFGVLEERDGWRGLQQWFACYQLDPTFAWWLEMSLLAGAIPGFGIADFDRILMAHSWQPRGWPWIEPLKDQKANTEGLSNGTLTLKEIAEANGQDWQDVLDQRAEEQKYGEEIQLKLAAPVSVAVAPGEVDDDGKPPSEEETEEAGTGEPRSLNGTGGKPHGQAIV